MMRLSACAAEMEHKGDGCEPFVPDAKSLKWGRRRRSRLLWKCARRMSVVCKFVKEMQFQAVKRFRIQPPHAVSEPGCHMRKKGRASDQKDTTQFLRAPPWVSGRWSHSSLSSLSSPKMAIDLGQRESRGGNWLRNSSAVKEEGFPLGARWLVLYASYGSLPSIRGHLPSHHHCQTLYCRQMDACVFLRTKRKTEEECSNILGWSCWILECLRTVMAMNFKQ